MHAREDLLGLDAETMRQLGYRTVDLIVELLTDRAAPPLRRATPEEMRRRVAAEAPARGEPFEDVVAHLFADVLPFGSRVAHPGFFAFVPGCPTWPGALGDFVAAATNVYAGSWMESAGVSQIELDVVRWFAEWIGYPPDAAGVMVNGGSYGNLTALACAREMLVGEQRGELVVYVSDQGHSSLARAAKVLGFNREQVRVLPTDETLRLPPEILSEAVDADRAAGRKPLLLCANAGTTNTGAVDPLPELANVCREHGLWFHVDAAYGGFAALTSRGRAALRGIERADSVTLDPHKWLYQPYECGCVLVREPTALRRAFEITPDYLAEASAHEGEVNFSDYGIQLTRTARALKVWLSVRTFGVDAFRATIDRTLDLAELAAARVRELPNLELASSPSLGTVCFRRRFDEREEERNAQLIAALEETGTALVSATRLHGRYAIRMCILNHTTLTEDVERVLEFLATAEPPPTEILPLERDRTLSFLDVLPPEAAGRGVVHEVEAGTTIVEQWELSRDFYVLLDGSVEVRANGQRVAELQTGAFFGELAALDWGAGFGYPRLASVIATTRVRLLVFPDAVLPELVREYPGVAAMIHAAVHERVPTVAPGPRLSAPSPEAT
jgi:aromatic-L-amino-acid decarboxylase